MIYSYHIGLFPTLTGELNGTACWTKARPCATQPWGEITAKTNGGVPQAADLAAHTAQVKVDVANMIPDEHFDGILVVDYEAWRPLFSECCDSLSLYREYFARLVRADPAWPAGQNASEVAAEAERRFNAGAKTFFVATVAAIRGVRPHARVGFYSQRIDGSNSTAGMESNAELAWLWEIVDVLCPSIYPHSTNATSEAARAAGFIAGAISSAAMVTSKSRPAVMPYGRAMMLDAKSQTPFTPGIVAAQIQVAAGMGAEGVILWGASSDYRGDGCGEIEEVLTGFAGPTVQTCIANRAACAAQHCHGRGRCVDYDPSRLAETCVVDDAPAVACRCDAGSAGADCSGTL